MARIFAIDPRGLAVWRIALAVLVLLDLRLRWPIAEAMYADSGWLPRSSAGELGRLLAGDLPAHAIWSVFWLNGTLAFVQAMMVLTGLAAVAVLVGWQTRFWNVILWVLVASIHARNPLVTTSADTLLKLMLMWGMFLPLGRVWSLDARRRRIATKVGLEHSRVTPNEAVRGERKAELCATSAVLSLATVGLILQLVQLYVFTGIAKLNGPWLDGTAMEYVLRLDIYTTTLGQRLLAFPGLLWWISWGTLALELGLIWLVLVPWRSVWPRLLLIAAFWGFHIGIALSMQIGLFSPICMSIWLVTLPASCWDWLTGKRIPAASSAPLPASRMGARGLVSALCGLLIALTIVWNILQTDPARFPMPLRTVVGLAGHGLALDQRFQMFGRLHEENSWFVYRAQLADGSEADVFRDIAPPVLEKPPRVAETFDNHNWRKLHDNLTLARLAAWRKPLLEFIVRQWNTRHDSRYQVVTAELIKLSQPIGPGYNGIDQRTAIWATAGDPAKRPGSQFDEMLRRMKSGTEPAF